MGIRREWLVRRIEYRAHVAEVLESIGELPEEKHRRAEERVAAVEAKLLPGDEVWEWRHDGGGSSSSGGRRCHPPRRADHPGMAASGYRSHPAYHHNRLPRQIYIQCENRSR